jgi:hypothetical protein
MSIILPFFPQMFPYIATLAPNPELGEKACLKIHLKRRKIAAISMRVQSANVQVFGKKQSFSDAQVTNSSLRAQLLMPY